MARILVDPEELRGTGQQFLAAAGQIRGVADRFVQAANACAWEIRQRSNINQQAAAARSRAEALAQRAEELAGYLARRAQDFQDADNAGVQDLAGLSMTAGSRLDSLFPGGHRWRSELEGWTRLSPLAPAASALPVAAVPFIAGGTTGPSFGPMAAHITTLKQANSEWADVEVGPNTWGKVGCTLTSIAMTITYYHPEAKVDRAFMEDLKSGLVNSAGNVDWYGRAVPYLADNYGLNLKREALEGSQAEMLPETMSKIVANLKQEPPAPSILGVNKPMHWVVVSGFKGDPANPKPEDFLLNDPGKNRATLADLLTDPAYQSSSLHALVTITRK